MKKIKVELGADSYNIITGSQLLKDIGAYISKFFKGGKIMVVADQNVVLYHKHKINETFTGSDYEIHYYYLPPGERSKSYTTLNRIYTYMLENGFGRDSLIIGIGGGVTGDLTGYAASTYMRGISLIHVPTTLLAMVDSAIGGKTGINFNNKKNMIGTFYQPKLVLSDTDFLKSLPKPEMVSGTGELIKYAFLAGYDLYGFMLKNISGILNGDEKAVEKVIHYSAGIKSEVVSSDEKETGLRKILNLGHTFAHGFESELNFKVKHGEAVTAGIISALYLSNEMGILSSGRLEHLLKLPLSIKLSRNFKRMNSENLLNIMSRDKKNRGGKIKFVLLKDAGTILIDVEAPAEKVISSLERTYKILGIDN